MDRNCCTGIICIILQTLCDCFSQKKLSFPTAILTVTSPILPLMFQPEVYWLLKQRVLLFCGWQKLNIKRVFCKQWISLQHQMSETNFEVIYQIRETVFMELFQENFYSFSFSKMQNRFWYTYKLILEFCPRKTEIVRYPIGFRPNFSSLVY